MKLNHWDLDEVLMGYLPDGLHFDYMMYSFRKLCEPHENFRELELEEIVNRRDIKHFNNWFDEERTRRLKDKNG